MYTFGDDTLTVVPRAELIPPFGRPNRTLKRLMQDALNECHEDMRENPHAYDWRGGSVNTFTLVLESDETVPQFVVRRSPGEDVVWGRCGFHTARQPKTAPFVLRREPAQSSELTIELIRIKRQTCLVRAYGGGYMPPLPWQASVENYKGGAEESHYYWQDHAFVMAKHVLGTGGFEDHPPAWAR